MDHNLGSIMDQTQNKITYRVNFVNTHGILDLAIFGNLTDAYDFVTTNRLTSYRILKVTTAVIAEIVQEG